MNSAPSENRYWTIDSLRGIAALAVALYHIDLVTLAHADGVIAHAINQLLKFGYLGVSIFFVISGFVIAASTSNDPVDFRYFGKFMVKRQARLDPTYWCSIALDIVLSLIAVKLLIASTPIPDVASVIVHVFYLQDLVGVRNIAAIYWTLCLEVQFYIFLCLTLAIHNHVNRKYHRNLNIKGWLFFVVTFYSMLVSAEIVEPPLKGLFVSYWILFAMGAAAHQWGIKNQNNNWAFPAVLLAMSSVFFYQMYNKGTTFSLSLGLACATAVLLYVGARRKKLGTWLRNDVLLYLGARSYSIYLFHTIIGERVAGVVTQLIYPKMGLVATEPEWAVMAFAAGIATSLVAAELAYRFIEMPSLALSKRIKPSKPGSAVKELFSSRQRTAGYNY